MRAIGLAVIASATLAIAIPARANAEMKAYAWYRVNAKDGSFIDTSITAQQSFKFVTVAIDHYNWRLRDPVVESLRCRFYRASWSFMPGEIVVDISDGWTRCEDQHAGNKAVYVLLSAHWHLYDDGVEHTVTATANIRTAAINGYVYVDGDDPNDPDDPYDPAIFPDVGDFP
jgi:hypothetical protein